MNPFDTLEFSYRVLFHSFDLAAWVWAVSAFIFIVLVLGRFWGMLWNARWSFFGHLPSAFLSLVLGFLVAASVLAWRSADRTASWILSLRDDLARQITSSGTINRTAFSDAAEKLQPLGGQGDRVPVSQGGTELHLSGPSDATMVAYTAANAAKRYLLKETPFVLGAPCVVRDPTVVAEEVVKAVGPTNFPVDIGAVNPWSKAALTAQVHSALDAAARTLAAPSRDLQSALLVLGLLLIVTQIVLVPVAALHDIKAQPKV